MYGHPWQANYGAAKAGLVDLMNRSFWRANATASWPTRCCPPQRSLLASEKREGWMEVTSRLGRLGQIEFGSIGDGHGPGAEYPAGAVPRERAMHVDAI